MRVAMIGTGYVGLVSGACFADFGHVVTCIDKDPSKIERLERGEIPIYEPGLDDLVAANVREGRLFFTLDGAEAIRNADAVFIAVGTPTRRGDGHADLTYVHAAAEEIAGLIEGFTVVVTKSTVPVGTGDEVEAIIRKANPNADFAVVSNPEFLREGAAIGDFKRPDRVVIGVNDMDGDVGARAQKIMSELYRPLNLNESPLLFVGRRTSELIKYAANAFLAMKITFINEMADLCEAVGADVQQVARGIGLDRLESPARRPRLWRLLLSQGHHRPGAYGPAVRRPDAADRSDGRGQRRAQEGDGRTGRDDPWRQRGGQNHRLVGPDVQAEYGRYARRPVPGHRPRPDRRRRQGPGLRSRGDARGGQAAARRGDEGERL